MTVADVLSRATNQQVKKIYARIGMDPRTLGRINTNNLAPWIAAEISAVLNIPAHELFGRPDQ